MEATGAAIGLVVATGRGFESALAVDDGRVVVVVGRLTGAVGRDKLVAEVGRAKGLIGVEEAGRIEDVFNVEVVGLVAAIASLKLGVVLGLVKVVV